MSVEFWIGVVVIVAEVVVLAARVSLHADRLRNVEDRMSSIERIPIRREGSDRTCAPATDRFLAAEERLKQLESRVPGHMTFGGGRKP